MLHTGIQWKQLPVSRNEICWSNVYKHHNRWSKDGSYERLFRVSVLFLKERNLLDLSLLHGDGSNVVAKKRGQKIGYSGHKHQKGEKVLAVSDNRGNIVAPIVVFSVNVHDTRLFPTSLSNLCELAYYLELDIAESFFTLDSGFDSRDNYACILDAEMFPVIKPNLRGTKNQKKREKRLNAFEKINKKRFPIERCFAWEDKYRKLVIRYETLQSTFMGFRYLAYSMINFRWAFGRN